MSGCATTPIQYTQVTPPSFAPFTKPSLGRPAIALVLGGGGSRGFAHVGVINALEANGIQPDIIVGTSAGSYVGALYAGGYNPAALQRIALEISEQDLRDIVFPDRGFVKGALVQDTVNRFLYNRNIEELPRSFAAVATNLQTGNLIAFDRGNTGMAVRASSSIPGIFQPVHIDGHDYVDGGLVSPVPVRVARDMGAKIIIAVDVSKKPENTRQLKTITEILSQSIAIMEINISADEIKDADIIIQPDVSEIGVLDFAHKIKAIDAGAAAALKLIPKIDKLLGRPPPQPNLNFNLPEYSFQ